MLLKGAKFLLSRECDKGIFANVFLVEINVSIYLNVLNLFHKHFQPPRMPQIISKPPKLFQNSQIFPTPSDIPNNFQALQTIPTPPSPLNCPPPQIQFPSEGNEQS